MINVLFFDDDPYIIFPLVEILEKEFGWKGDKKIIPVCDTCQLLKEIYNDKIKYDLFVLDVVAPICPTGFTKEELDDIYFGFNLGLVIARKIRKMKKYKDVPILYLSARLPHIPESEKEITFFLEKPTLEEKISNAMRILLGINSQSVDNAVH